jgi:4-O-beta-D-mannosyl-D-glucose phosphorylase
MLCLVFCMMQTFGRKSKYMNFKQRISKLVKCYEALLSTKNSQTEYSNGIYQRWVNPVVTAKHAPVHWRYDFCEAHNPSLMERIGVNATLNSGAIFMHGKYLLMVRVEGNDRKSFFAVAESPNGVDNFRFWDYPVTMPETAIPDTNTYDMRLVKHEDDFIYGLFCTERKDNTKPDDLSAAEAQCGIARSKDLVNWERLPDLITYSGQQRNVVLHPEFIDGKYALYTRPQDGFISVGGGGGIGWGLTDSMENAEIKQEVIVDTKVYHTVKEMKNGQGPAPIKTPHGWLHLAHGVRNTAAGLRYVLYMFMTDLHEPWRVTHRPGGHFIAPEGQERIGDVSNVVFSNGWTVNDNNDVHIYYASSDTRMHVATSTIEQLIDYVMNTPEDGLTSANSVKTVKQLIAKNLLIMKSQNGGFLAK